MTNPVSAVEGFFENELEKAKLDVQILGIQVSISVALASVDLLTARMHELQAQRSAL